MRDLMIMGAGPVGCYVASTFDGDVVFAVSCWQFAAEVMVLAALGQEAVRQAIVNAVRAGK